MTSNDQLYHVIKDPVHGTMQFTSRENAWIKPFIDSPSFQRLRHIKQMGMGDFIFPGSVHTRFNHSLGCCYVASQIAQKIGLDEASHQRVMLACLLHDIGHGPFSHVFEDLFYKKAIPHEAWTPFFLKIFDNPDFFERYNRHNPNHPLTQHTFEQISRMIMHNAPDNTLLADIVSSQLDADRLDYLLRDNHFCGVKYGEFDLRWMLNAMVALQTDTGTRLGISHKGIGVVEHYLMARRLMIKNIYHHRKKLALEFFLIELLAALAKSLDYFPAFNEIRLTPTGEFLLAVNQFNEKAMRPNADISALRKQFLEDQHADYQALCDYDIFAILRMLAASDENHTAIHLAKRILHRQMPLIIEIEITKIAKTQAQIAECHSHGEFEPWQLALIQSPHYSYLSEADPIWVQTDQGVIQPLEQISPIIHALSGYIEQTVFLCVDQAIAQHPRLQGFLPPRLNLSID